VDRLQHIGQSSSPDLVNCLFPKLPKKAPRGILIDEPVMKIKKFFPNDVNALHRCICDQDQDQDQDQETFAKLAEVMITILQQVFTKFQPIFRLDLTDLTCNFL
jgi:hypothetical protein